MPKEGRGRSWWNRRLAEYAAGSRFGRGETPGHGTWARQQVDRIRLCPVQYGARIDGRGQPLRCGCGWHRVRFAGLYAGGWLSGLLPYPQLFHMLVPTLFGRGTGIQTSELLCDNTQLLQDKHWLWYDNYDGLGN